jgi:carbonic anhydrase
MMQRYVNGIKKFQQEVFPAHRQLFADLAAGQKPSVLFITCGDSRIVPDLMMQTKPGELFILRNAGNIIPSYSENSGGVTATIEYAVVALNIPNIVVCGHSNCGAMNAILHPEQLNGMDRVSQWLRHSDAAARVVTENYTELCDSERLEILAKENVIAQIENLKTHAPVAARLARGAVNVYGWYYDIRTGDVQAYDAAVGDFVPLDEERIPAAAGRTRQLAAVAR